MLTFVYLDDFLPNGNCVVLLAQVFCQGSGLTFSIPHINSDLISFDLQQDIVLLDKVACRQQTDSQQCSVLQSASLFCIV